MADAMALVALCRARGLRVASAESCTGGLVAAAITGCPGASAVFTHGFVTYANAAKTEMLGVPAALIARLGAVSAEVAAAMAQGARLRARADIAVGVTGIAGPGGGSAEKPVGTVWFGLAAQAGDVATHLRVFPGTRDEIRAASLRFALDLLRAAAGGPE
ncbi:MAG: nicotinamide-nucleotide amidohydrolase family protein [Acidocella sp.]|nr:nicotinamide-nucleotide amidohydrolase family protein [Acidocella sp.]